MQTLTLLAILLAPTLACEVHIGDGQHASPPPAPQLAPPPARSATVAPTVTAPDARPAPPAVLAPNAPPPAPNADAPDAAIP